MTNDENSATVPSRPQGVCLMEIWASSDKRAPSHFWREMQADGVFSLWRFMEPAFAKKALRARTFTLDKDKHFVTYAAKRADVRTLTLDDYERVKTLRAAFRTCVDPALLCRECQGSKEIQATRRVSATEVQRFVIGCPSCASRATEAEIAATGDADIQAAAKAEAIARIGEYVIVEEVPGLHPGEPYYIRKPDGLPLKLADETLHVTFETIEAARQHLRLALIPDECISVSGYEP